MILALLWAGLCLLSGGSAAAGQSQAVLFVPDRAVLPGTETFLEAILLRRGVLGVVSAGIQGETLVFLDESGAPLAQKLTDPSGLARTAVRAPSSGLARYRVELADNPRFRAEPETGRVFVWNNARPPLLVCVEGGLMRSQAGTPSFLTHWARGEEYPGSREILSRLVSAHDLAYLTRAPRPGYAGVRRWLEDRGFPEAPVLSIESSSGLHQEAQRTSPKVRLLESLWKDRGKPAYLVTADPALAEAAAKSGFRTYLLESESGAPQQREEESAEGGAKNPVRVRGWEEVDPRPLPSSSSTTAPKADAKEKERRKEKK